MDNRDAGLSTATDETDSYTLSDMANDTVAVLDAVGVETTVVLGLSLGGMVAQQLAIDHPERVRALVSLASTPGEEGLPTATPEVLEALTAPSEATVEEQVEADLRHRKLWSNPDWYDIDPLREFFTELHNRAFVPGGGMRQFNAAMGSPSRIEGLQALDVPTLVVHGENDSLLPPEHGVPRDRRHVARLRVSGVAPAHRGDDRPHRPHIRVALHLRPERGRSTSSVSDPRG